MDNFNIYLIGVGGQGIGLLSAAVTRAADYAGKEVQAVDTHGLAQRGGIVESHVRIGTSFSPLIPRGQANLVLALEINEALRGLQNYLDRGGTLLYSQTCWQPLEVRLQLSSSDPRETLTAECTSRNIREIAAPKKELEDPRLENSVLLGIMAREKVVPGLKKGHYSLALQDLMAGSLLAKNLKIFSELATT